MRRLALSAVTAFALVGCGASRPPNQLVDARMAYQQAVAHPSAGAAPNELLEARQTLDAAELAFKDGDKDEAKNYGYIAHRKALSAQAKADAARARDVKRVAIAEFDRLRDMQAMATREELERAKGALTSAQQEAEAQRQARTAAEDKVKQLEGVQAEESQRGLVLTLSGSVLFPSGKSELLASAKDRLSEVAKALKEDSRTVLIVGHTDSQGSHTINEKLSDDRAKAVRMYLITQGVEDQRIRSEGMGESLPVADNTSAEGRANNRRVEIVLEKSPGSGHVEGEKKEQAPAKTKGDGAGAGGGGAKKKKAPPKAEEK